MENEITSRHNHRHRHTAIVWRFIHIAVTFHTESADTRPLAVELLLLVYKTTRRRVYADASSRYTRKHFGFCLWNGGMERRRQRQSSSDGISDDNCARSDDVDDDSDGVGVNQDRTENEFISIFVFAFFFLFFDYFFLSVCAVWRRARHFLPQSSIRAALELLRIACCWRRWWW